MTILFFTRSLIAVFAASCVTFSYAQIIQSVGTLLRGKSALEFYEAAVANPQQIFLLSLEIRVLFAADGTRYKGLSNELAQKLKWFDNGSLGLAHIALNPEKSPSSEYGNYSITLKQLKFKQCEVLSNHSALNESFLRVELNGKPVAKKGDSKQTVEICEYQWFWQDGKNELKYIGG